jgi:hypothetical protein
LRSRSEATHASFGVAGIEVAGAPAPVLGHLGQAAMGLGGSGGDGGLLAEPHDLDACRVAAMVGDEGLDQLVFGGLDLFDAL